MARLGTCVAGVALGDIGLHLAWQAWCLVTSTVTLRGRRTYGTGLALVARSGALVVAAVCVAGVALGDIDVHSAWQAWHLWHWTGSGGALCDIDLHFAWQAWH